MKIEITGPAKADIEQAVAYIEQESARAARLVAERILRAISSLGRLPHRGRPGRVDGTRELVIGRTRYIAVYRVEAQVVVVIRVLHGHQDWPIRK